MELRTILYSTLAALWLTSCAVAPVVVRTEEKAAAPSAAAPPSPAIEKAQKAPEVPGEPNGGRGPAFSPDGTRIAFLSSTLHTPADLWVMNSDGTEKKRLTHRGVLHFRWAPDGRSILFASRRKGYEEVFSVDADGRRGEERFPGLPPNAGVPLFSPDGKLFAFTAPGEGGVRDLWIGTADRSRIEPVTEKISVRSVFWGPDGRRVYYEAGKTYGVGIWELDLSAMESKVLISKYIGTPEPSRKSGLIAYAYPTNPGEFEVRTMKLDGSEVSVSKAPRLAERWIAWDGEERGVYYLGQDVEIAAADNAIAGGDNTAGPQADKPKEKPGAPHKIVPSAVRPFGVTALWRLDLATGMETRISPAELHLSEFSISPDGRETILVGVTQKSRSTELFRLDLASGAMAPLVASRVSEWMPVPSPDSSKIAFFTNEGGLDTLKVVRYTGEDLASYPGFVQEGDARLFWLPEAEGLLLFSGRGILAFTDNGAIDFPSRGDHRAYLFADVSIQEDKVLISTIPRYGETPGLYMLAVAGGKFVQTDLRFPPTGEKMADLYLQPRWSLDGRKIAFTDGVDAWAMLADGTGRTRVTRYREANREGKGNPSLASFPFWSVGADRIGFTLTAYDGKRTLREVWMVREDGSEPARVFSEEHDSQFQAFLPEYTYQPFFDATDERMILTASREGVPNIAAVDIKDGGLRWLTETGAIYPVLLPEEGVIVFISLEGNEERLWVMNADGTEKRPFVVERRGGDGASGKGNDGTASPVR